MLLLLLHLAGAPSPSEPGRRSKAISWEVITNLQPHLPCILLLPTSTGNDYYHKIALSRPTSSISFSSHLVFCFFWGDCRSFLFEANQAQSLQFLVILGSTLYFTKVSQLSEKKFRVCALVDAAVGKVVKFA